MLEKKSQKPIDSAWRQQRLPYNKVVLIPITFLPLLGITGLVCVGLGVMCYFVGDGIADVEVDYTDCNGFIDGTEVACKDTLSPESEYYNRQCTCEIEVTVPEMAAPVNLYYELDGFLQAHRRLLRSVSDLQLRYSESLKDDFTEECQFNALYANPATGENTAIAPCGQLANMFFNDTFTLWDASTQQIPMSADEISILSDRAKKFKNPAPTDDLVKAYEGTVRPAHWDFLGPRDATVALFGSEEVGWGFENQDFMNWMRASAFSTAQKLYRRIKRGDDTLAAGTYTVRAAYNYPSLSYGARKKIKISQVSWLGGKGTTLGIMYMAVGGILLVTDFILLVLYFVKPRKLGDSRLLKKDL